MAEGGGLLNRYRGLNPYRGFESPSLRHLRRAKELQSPGAVRACAYRPRTHQFVLELLLQRSAGTARLVIVICGGLAIVGYGGPLGALYAVVALGMTVWGTTTLYAVRATDWSRH